tara:strand:+ start:258 stop:776 length:519 start_codon:yes stop_codon:yes gene_type:complete
LGIDKEKLMTITSKKLLLFSFLFLLCFLSITTPDFISIQGIYPAWLILWLIPSSLEFGPIYGLFFGFCCGIFLDSMMVIEATNIPGLLLIGFFVGRLDQKSTPIELSLNFGLLAWISSFFLGISLLIQIYFNQDIYFGSQLNYWAFYSIFSQSIITALLAPIICSWIKILIK